MYKIIYRVYHNDLTHFNVKLSDLHDTPCIYNIYIYMYFLYYKIRFDDIH